MPDRRLDETRTTSPSWWARNRFFWFAWVLALWTMQWALKQLGWLFGWTGEPRQDRSDRILDAMVILAAAIFLMVHAIRHSHRNDAARKAMLDQFHEKAERAKRARNLHA
jgi:hypothetical protein